MAARSAEAVWNGTIGKGSGTIKFASGAFEGAYSVPSRFADGEGTNPEELIAAAHAGCYSMAFSSELTRAGYKPTRIHTIATVHIDKADGGGFEIPLIELSTEAEIPGIDEATFQAKAEDAKVGCPVSKALAGPRITLKAKLV